MAKYPQDHDNPCAYCKESNSLVLYPTSDIRNHPYTLNQCLQCKAVFLAPRPDAQRLSEAYDDTYYGEKQDKFSMPMIEKSLDFFRMGRARRLSSFLHAGASILDIGCGNGKFLWYMTQLGDYKIHGIELPGNSALRAAKIPGIQLNIGRIQADLFSAASFDAVSLFHVFEHLEEPRETLDIIDKILKPGGILMMSFPNINSLQSGIFKGKWLHLDPPRHLFFFRPADIGRIMEDKGYDIKRIRYASLEQNPFGMVQSILNCILKKREVLFERLKGNMAYAPEYGPFSIAFQKLFFVLASPLFILSDILVSSLKKGATVEFVFQKRK